jgi:type I restriction enzyme R subunit
MSTHAYTEDQLVEQPAIGLFAELGWTTVSVLEETSGATGTLRLEMKGEPVLVSQRHNHRGRATQLRRYAPKLRRRW